VFDRFRTLSQAQQIMLIAGLLIVFCAGFALVWLAFIRTPYQPVFNNLRPVDAATIIADLDRKKVPYRLADGGATILVPADRVDALRLNVMTEDLPLKGTVGFELFNKSDMGLTDFAQKINYQRALQGELERTIMALDGVADARVHLSLGEDRIFRDDQVPPKASVSVRMLKGIELDPRAVQGIQRLVAAAVPKLDSGEVVVLDEHGRVVSVAPEAESLAPPSPGEQEKHAIEQYYEGRIRQSFAQTTLPYRVIVSVGTSTEQSGEGQNYSAWTPTGRDFPLLIKVSSVETLDAASQTAIRNLVAMAVGSNAAKPDTIEFNVAREATRVEEPPVTSDIKPRPWHGAPEVEEDRGWFGEAMLALLPLAVLASIVLGVRAAYRSRRLSTPQRARFADRLRSALKEAENYAPP